MDSCRGYVLPALLPLRSCAGHKVQLHTAPFPFPPVFLELCTLTAAARGSHLRAGFVPFCPFPGTEHLLQSSGGCSHSGGVAKAGEVFGVPLPAH